MSKITVLTLHGESASGKDATYQALKDYNPNLPRVSFGDLLRGELYESLNLTPDQVGDERKVQMLGGVNTTFKDLMVSYGAKMLLVDPFYFVHKIGARIVKASEDSGNPLVIVTDCRRPHELRELRRGFRTYSFRLFYRGSVTMPLDHLLDRWPGIVNLTEDNTIEDNCTQILHYMMANLPTEKIYE